MFQRQSFCDLSCTYYLQFPTLPCPHANASITAEEKRVLFPRVIHTPERQSRRVWWGCLRESGQCLSLRPGSPVYLVPTVLSDALVWTWPLAKQVRLSALGLFSL